LSFFNPTIPFFRLNAATKAVKELTLSYVYAIFWTDLGAFDLLIFASFFLLRMNKNSIVCR